MTICMELLTKNFITRALFVVFSYSFQKALYNYGYCKIMGLENKTDMIFCTVLCFFVFLFHMCFGFSFHLGRQIAL